MKRKHNTDFDPAEIVELYSRGLTYRQIAQRLKISTGAVYNAMHRKTKLSQKEIIQKPKIRPRGALKGKKYDYALVIKKHADGRSNSQIAKDLDISTKTVYRVLKRARPFIDY